MFLAAFPCGGDGWWGVGRSCRCAIAGCSAYFPSFAADPVKATEFAANTTVLEEEVVFMFLALLIGVLDCELSRLSAGGSGTRFSGARLVTRREWKSTMGEVFFALDTVRLVMADFELVLALLALLLALFDPVPNRHLVLGDHGRGRVGDRGRVLQVVGFGR